MVIDIPNPYQKRIVIIGGGFGGITLAKSLIDKRVQVVIVDRNNYHTFQPLLYQVATSMLEAESIAYPIRRIFAKSKNVFFRLGEVKKVEANENRIVIDNDSLSYDYLVIATGSKTNYFGNEGLTVSSMPMKSVSEALELRSMILQNLEMTLRNSNERKRQGMMNIVIAGAGPTGVELAGALGEMKQQVFPKDYPELDLSQMNIYIVQSGARVLPMLSEQSSAKAQKYLEDLGVKVVLNTRVLDLFGDYVQTSTGQDIIARTLVWTAGVVGHTVAGLGAGAVNPGGRVEVDAYNRVKGHGNVFALGDVACMASPSYPKGHPMVAPAAMQQGKQLAENLLAEMNNRPMKPFTYKDKGAMATIGKNKAVVELGTMHFSGVTAWFVWMLVHLVSLVGYRNKAITLFNWFKNYLNSDRGIRLIITPFDLYEEKRKRKKRLDNRNVSSHKEYSPRD